MVKAEKRAAADDGVKYTRAQFLEFYGKKTGAKKWDDAGKVPDYSGLEKGMRLQGLADGKWYSAEVVVVSKKSSSAPVKVRWVGYTKDSDEWLGADRLRSKAITMASPGKEKSEWTEKKKPRWNPGPATAAYVAPGECVFSSEWAPAPLVSKVSISHDTRIFTFGLEDGKALGLSTCACLLMKGVEGPKDAEGNPVIRPYTPVSTNKMTGKFELMVKVYPDGKMSQHLDALEIGKPVHFKHVGGNVKIQYPFNSKKEIGMIVGGTGITPMIQALHCVLGTREDTSKVSVLYGSKTSKEILAKQTLAAWAKKYPKRLQVTHVLSEEPEEGSSWKGARGFITRELIEAKFPKPDSDCLIFVCGPPALYNVFSGPRDAPGQPPSELAGLLKEMGYKTEQVIKF
jgi:cytochrome-b5 reductase